METSELIQIDTPANIVVDMYLEDMPLKMLNFKLAGIIKYVHVNITIDRYDFSLN